MYLKYFLVIFAFLGALYCDWELMGTCKTNSTNPFSAWVVGNNGNCAKIHTGRYSKFQCVDSNTAYSWSCRDAECFMCEEKTQYDLRTCYPSGHYFDCSADTPDWAALLQTQDYVLVSYTTDNCTSIITATATPLDRCVPDVYYPSKSWIWSCGAADVFATAYEENNCQGQDHQSVTPITSCSKYPNEFQHYECFHAQTRNKKN